ncbi:archease [Methylocystis sp. FS]|uniref:archease n=1 Tax=Methylocystis silviterrae TaxID=2743612 RepID=UPI0015839163|nr:archease [Methylocystis silviterrae]NUJ79712.1 archease [Methylocystis silviterrae]
MAVLGDHSATVRWEHFPHDADIGVRGYGATPGEACEQAALATMAAILDPATVRLEQTVDFALEAPRLDLLLVDWLNALIYEMAERRMVFGAFHVKIENDRLKGRALGEAVSRARHAPAVEVKGATYTELAFVEDRPGLWRAQCVIDV